MTTHICLATDQSDPVAAILRIVADWHRSSEGGDVLIEELTQAGFPLPDDDQEQQ